MTETALPEDSMLAAEYALGLMGTAESRAFVRRLDDEPLLYQEYKRWLEYFSPLVFELPHPEPAASLKAKVEKHVFGHSYSHPNKSLWKLFLDPRFISGLVVAALISLVLYRAIPPAFVPTHIAELATEDQRLAMTVKYDPAAKLLRINNMSTRLPGSDRDFELWVIADGKPVSLGGVTLDSVQNINVPVELSEKLVGATLAISDEPIGGSPTGQPTGAVLATATVKAI